MTKVLFLLSAVVMVVAGFFIFQNREAFKATRLERQQNDGVIASELAKLSTLGDEVVQSRSQVATITNEVSAEQSRLEQINIKLRNAETKAANAAKELEAEQMKIAKYKKEMDDLPQGVNLETINEDINKRKATIVENETKLAEIQKVVDQKEAEVKRVQNDLASLKNRIEERRKSFDRNSMTATIVAVNNDWGFVVIAGGEEQGISEDTKLIVSRGTQALGKLNIVSVEGNRTIANIIPESLRSGLSIAPGDKVILETLAQ
jgi:peptidoglycan hydrolase CwlO-like protein